MNQTRNIYQRNTSWNAPYTFSSKEKDIETGYGYFGARYYDSGLSIWLSVDPMSDKYPSMSPYNYCANNPVILVDPDGRAFLINGPLAQEFITQLNHHTGLGLTLNDKGFEHCTNTEGNGELLDFILLEITKADSPFYITIETTDHPDVSGENDGAVFCRDKDNKISAMAYMIVNPTECERRDKLVGDGEKTGGYVVHEVAEAYYTALLTMAQGESSPTATRITNFWGKISYPPGCVYPEAHRLANLIMKGGFLIKGHSEYSLQELTNPNIEQPEGTYKGETYHRVE